MVKIYIGEPEQIVAAESADRRHFLSLSLSLEEEHRRQLREVEQSIWDDPGPDSEHDPTPTFET